MRDVLFAAVAVILVLSVLAAASPLVTPVSVGEKVPAAGACTGIGTEAEWGDEPLCVDVLPFLLPASEAPSAAGAYDLLYGGKNALPAPIPEGCVPIVTKDLSARGDVIPLSNETKFRPDTAALSVRELRIPAAVPAFASGEEQPMPLVLILHTHATEAYSEDGAVFVSPGQSFYSSDPAQSVLAVGETLCRELNDLGIPSIHSTARHDASSGGDAYKQAKKTISDALSRYPSIRYVLDLHRDSIVTSDGVHIRPVADIGGEPVAQIMFVMGTNEAGAAHPDWEDNLALACRLQKRLSDLAPSLTRPINLRRASFNEQYTPGSMLIEVGSDVNSLPEALRAARLLARGLADVIREVSG